MIHAFLINVENILGSALPITILKVVIVQNVLLVLKKKSSCSVLRVHIREWKRKDVCVRNV
jgi:hypothetical protein